MLLIAIVAATVAAGVGSVWLAAWLMRSGLEERFGIGAQHLLSLAAGALLATAFIHLLPEAFESGIEPSVLFATLLGGVLFFFLLDKAELWHHGHEHGHGPAEPSAADRAPDAALAESEGLDAHARGVDQAGAVPQAAAVRDLAQKHDFPPGDARADLPTRSAPHPHPRTHPDPHSHPHAHLPLAGTNGAASGGWTLLTGDSVHCFGDGVLIASAFAAAPGLGAVAAIAVLAHEVPHHMGDLVVLRRTSGTRRAALVKVSLAGSVTALGGIVGFLLLGQLHALLPYFLVLAASSFIYVALADLIPQLQQRLSARQTAGQLVWLAIGLVVVTLVSGLAERAEHGGAGHSRPHDHAARSPVAAPH